LIVLSEYLLAVGRWPLAFSKSVGMMTDVPLPVLSSWLIVLSEYLLAVGRWPLAFSKSVGPDDWRPSS